MSLCKKFLETGETCTEDYQCQIKDYCWFASSDDVVSNSRTCMEKFLGTKDPVTEFGWYQEGEEPTLDDYRQNGKYCESGLAFNVSDDQGVPTKVARCTETETIRFDYEDIEAPYKFTPTDPNKRC